MVRGTGCELRRCKACRCTRTGFISGLVVKNGERRSDRDVAIIGDLIAVSYNLANSVVRCRARSLHYAK